MTVVCVGSQPELIAMFFCVPLAAPVACGRATAALGVPARAALWVWKLVPETCPESGPHGGVEKLEAQLNSFFYSVTEPLWVPDDDGPRGSGSSAAPPVRVIM